MILAGVATIVILVARDIRRGRQMSKMQHQVMHLGIIRDVIVESKRRRGEHIQRVT